MTTKLKSVLIFCLAGLIPKRAKRIIFLSTLFRIIDEPEKEKTDIDPKTLKKLNDVLSLCHNEDALHFPCHLTNVMWNKDIIENLPQKVKGEIEPHELDLITDKVIKNAPSFMLYDSNRTMRQDIKLLIRSQNQIVPS